MRRTKKRKHHMDIDEIFLDSSNLPSYDKDRFEGRIEKPISKRSFYFMSLLFFCIVGLFFYRATELQIVKGDFYKEKSENNRLRHDILFAHRGIITDRYGKELAWNEFSEGKEYPVRKYITEGGFGNLLGFVKYPQKDSSGFYYTTEASGQDGIEAYYNEKLSGSNGVKLTEVNVKGDIESESSIILPENGDETSLSIDAGVQERLYYFVADAVERSGFEGGAGVIMDAKTGEVLAVTTYPEYKSEILSEGKDRAQISSWNTSSRKPFLDRAVAGLYAPGSIVKPFLALGALVEGIISPEKEIFSSGQISVPNPYNPSKPTIFKDWKAHGWTNLREAIAVSSDVYFYSVGGGFGDQKGLGISKIDEYVKKFLFGKETTGFFKGPTGNIPTPEWKKKTFGEEWLLGNTYHTSIGQYGFQVTPLQAARAVTGIANEGTIVEPVILKGEVGEKTEVKGISSKEYNEVKLGMQDAVLWGTAIALNIPGTSAGAKTGTAEVGLGKDYVNSWVEGFFPYDNPKYTFAVVLEKGPPTYKVSAMRVMGSVLSWVNIYRPEYFGKAPKREGEPLPEAEKGE